jgi:hypothetical protein
MPDEADPFLTPIIFLRIAWMDRYKGLGSGDKAERGGAWVEQHGFGHEIFNFQPYEGAMYGFVQAPGATNDNWSDATIDLTRLGGSDHDNSVSGVLTVWVATAPTGGTFVVGWYSNATVYQKWQEPPTGSQRRHAEIELGYYATASESNVILLQPDERLFQIPQQVKGGMGRANIWYADNVELNRQFRHDLLRYVRSRAAPTSQNPTTLPRQPDPFLRQKVERIAVDVTSRHFDRMGYIVDSVERVGWDLNAVAGKRELKLEVKGLSGNSVIVELSPNEYKAMKIHRAGYRVCVVSNALDQPRLQVFGYSGDTGQWVDSNGHVLGIEEIVAARCAAE